jgi:NADH:ubiquinone oxidoreductase subunit 6 (subunit J)
MELIYYTIAAIVLYTISDFILNRIEIKMGKRLPNRSFIFLIILFNLLQSILVPLESTQTTKTQVEQPNKVPDAIAPAKK